MTQTSQNEYSPQTCTGCKHTLTNPVPEKWAQKHPDLKGLCRDCAFAWISANVPEDRSEEVA